MVKILFVFISKNITMILKGILKMLANVPLLSFGKNSDFILENVG